MQERHIFKKRVTPLICVGEGQQERENGSAVHFVKNQIEETASFLGSDLLENVVLHMNLFGQLEPETSLKSPILEMHGAIRTLLVELIGKASARNISLLYGGSVSSENVLSIVDQENVDGVLVGGASVSMETFGTLLKNLAVSRH